jgi:hypothetical protein
MNIVVTKNFFVAMDTALKKEGHQCLLKRQHKRLKRIDHTEGMGHGGLQMLGFWRQADETAGQAEGAQETGANRQQDQRGLDRPHREYQTGQPDISK